MGVLSGREARGSWLDFVEMEVDHAQSAGRRSRSFMG